MRTKVRRLIALFGAVVMFTTCIPFGNFFINNIYAITLNNMTLFSKSDDITDGISGDRPGDKNEKDWFSDGPDKNYTIMNVPHLEFTTTLPSSAGKVITTWLIPEVHGSVNIAGKNGQWVLLFVEHDYNYMGNSFTPRLNSACELTNTQALELMKTKKIEGVRLASSPGSTNSTSPYDITLKYDNIVNMIELDSCQNVHTAEFWDIMSYALGGNLNVTQGNNSSSIPVLTKGQFTSINPINTMTKPLQYRSAGFNCEFHGNTYTQQSDGWSYVASDKGLVEVFGANYNDTILKVDISLTYKDANGAQQSMNINDYFRSNPQVLFVDKYNAGDNDDSNIYKRIRSMLGALAHTEYQAAGGTSASADEHITSDDLEEARSKDGNETSVNEWFFKINYFFATGADATDAEGDGGLGVDGPKITDYGLNWIKPGELEEAIDSDNGFYDGAWGLFSTAYGSQSEKGVTLEDDLRIRTYFNILAQYMYFGDDDKYNKSYSLNGQIYDSFSEYVRQLANTNYGMTNSPSTTTTFRSDDYVLMTPGVIDVGGTGDNNTTMSREKANAAAESRFRKVSEKPSYYSAAVNFDSIVDYYGYGIVSDEKYTDGAGNTGDIKYNAAIESCVPEFLIAMDNQLSDDGTNINKVGLSFNGLGLPRFDSFGRINRSLHSFKFYGEINTALMFIRQYAEIPKTQGALEGGSTTSISSGDEDGGEESEDEEEEEEQEDTGDVEDDKWYYNTGSKGTHSSNAMLEIQSRDAFDREVTNVEGLGKSELESMLKCPTLETFINKNHGNEGNSPNDMTDDVAKLIAAYVHIHNGLETLFGSESDIISNTWLSPELKRIYLYYDEIKQWENEPAVETATNTTEPDEREAFRMFFQFEDVDQPIFTDAYATGVALSATYIPLVTNLYDPEPLSAIDDSQTWVDEFHYKYGFNRKALFIDTDEDAAVKAYVTGEKSGLRVATLKDMLQPERDVVLYIDTNMYNINKVADMQQLAYSRIQNSEEAGTDSGGFFQSLGDGLANFMEIGAENIYKSGAVKLYSNKYASGSAAYGTDDGKAEKGMWFKSIWSPDNFILSTAKIEEYTYADEYQPMQGAAFTCGIYRDKDVYNICQNQSANPQPVFVSSPSLAGIKGQTADQYNTIFNYLMLKNIANNKQLDSDVDLDEDTPLFIDIYGNISTQSGLVVIPAACNASLYTPEDFNVATAGFLSVYNKFDSEKLPERYGNSDKYMSNYGFIIETSAEDNKNYWALDRMEIDGYTVYARGLGLSSNKIKKSLYSLGKQTFASNQLASTRLFNQRVNMVMEVMRGAPIEHIDFEREGLSGVRNIDKTSIYVTYRVEQLSDLFTSGSNGNSLVQLPNLAYMSHIEYVVVFLFKALFAVGLFIMMITIYVDGVAGVLGWKTILKFILSILSVVLGIIFVPSALNVSYYQTNKWLLQSEMTYMNMINTEKRALGKETGIVEVKKPESNSELFVKLDQVRIPWYVVAEDIFASNQFKKMNDVYNDAFQSSIYMAFDGVVQKGNGLYVSIDEILDSSAIVFANYNNESADTKGYIFQVITENQEMSYIMPYYLILDQLLYEIQVYNEEREGSSFVTKFKSDGNIMTYGLVEPYLLSNNFLEGSEDLVGLYSIYGIEPSSNRHVSVLDALPVGSDDSGEELRERMRRTLWCQKEQFSEEVLKEKLAKLDYEARKFVIENRFLLNKVSDETFIKCMALDLAIKHNDIFNVPAARSYEIMNIDTRDIMRMSLAPKSQVMKHASKSFANFVLSYGGFFAVCGVTMLIVMYWIVSLVKPLLMIVLLVLLIVSYIYNKLVRRQNNKSFEGYLVSITLMCLVNILYALSIKLSIWIPSLQVNALISILIQVVVQFLYVFVLLGIGYIVVKNASDIGFYTYKTMYDTHVANTIHSVQLSTDRLISRVTNSDSAAARRRAYNYSRNTRTSGLTGNDIMRQMQERDEELRNGRYRS